MHTNDNLEAIYAEAVRVSEGAEVNALVLAAARAYHAAQAALCDAASVASALLDKLAMSVVYKDTDAVDTGKLVEELARARARSDEAIEVLCVAAESVRATRGDAKRRRD